MKIKNELRLQRRRQIKLVKVFQSIIYGFCLIGHTQHLASKFPPYDSSSISGPSSVPISISHAPGEVLISTPNDSAIPGYDRTWY